MFIKKRTLIMTAVLAILIAIIATILVTDRLLVMYKAELPAYAASEKAEGKGTFSDKELKKLQTVLSLIESKYYQEIKREDIMDGAIAGMMNSLGDPYSVYMIQQAAEQFSESVEGSFSGIGAEVSQENGRVVVVSPIKGSPAEQAGILAKDIILSVNGESLDGLTLQEAVAKIRGPKGTKATVMISRAGINEPLELVLIRADIDVETVFASIDDKGYGLIEIRQFSYNTGERFEEELERLEEEGLKGLVIDVRNNPGGVLPVVIDIAQQFVPKDEPIVQVESRDGVREATLSKGTKHVGRYPVAVLMNGGSASASEILAAALKEKAKATLVGETTFGKGTVQMSYNQALGDGSLVKLTIAKWLTPNGDWINEKGVAPDVEVAPPALYTVVRLVITDQPLEQNMLGEQVRSAQVMLSELGYKLERKDGFFDALTATAVKQFQKDNSLKTSGKVDAKTAEALEKAVITWLQNDANDLQLEEAFKAVGRE